MSFWCLNIGLAWMVFATLLPLGVLQLYHSVNEGYFEARSLGYITRPGNAVLEWLRLPGDLIFIAGGILPFIWIAWQALRHFTSGETTDELPEHPLYIESSPPHRPKDRNESTRGIGLADGRLCAGAGRRGVGVRHDGPPRVVRAARWRTGGSPIMPTTTHGMCPQDQWLWPTSFDPQQPGDALPGQTQRVQQLPGEVAPARRRITAER